MFAYPASGNTHYRGIQTPFFHQGHSSFRACSRSTAISTPLFYVVQAAACRPNDLEHNVNGLGFVAICSANWSTRLCGVSHKKPPNALMR
jgi:hypothetical protein